MRFFLSFYYFILSLRIGKPRKVRVHMLFCFTEVGFGPKGTVETISAFAQSRARQGPLLGQRALFMFTLVIDR